MLLGPILGRFGLILEGFWEVLEGFGEDLWIVLGSFLAPVKICLGTLWGELKFPLGGPSANLLGRPYKLSGKFGAFWDVLTNLWKIRRLLAVNLKRDPRAAARSVTMRGGPSPRV